MDQHANTKNVSEPGQAQNPELQESARQAEEPDRESPRKCKICGGPNHRGCGCEARAAKIESEKKTAEYNQIAGGNRRTVGMLETEAPAALKLTQAERDETFRKVIDEIISRSSPEEIKILLKAQILPSDFAKDVKIISERSELIGDCLFDLCQCTKAITESLKTINDILRKDEVKKNASENQN